MRVVELAYDVLGVKGIARTLLDLPNAIPGFVIPAHTSEIPQPADRFTLEQRAGLSAILEEKLGPLAPHAAVLESVRSLKEPGACVVIAGQQPGFLASPLYNVHKALHVVRLARALALAWDRPVVPMFWNHADDHDLAEVNHVFVANENLDLQKIGLSGMSSGRQPFSRVILSEEKHRLSAIRATLDELLHSADSRAEALDIFCPRDGESLARAFTRSITDLFGHLGLVVLEPDWIRASLSHVMGEMIARSPASGPARNFEEALALGAAQIRALGHAPQIDPAQAALLYRVDERGRSALRSDGVGLRYDDDSGTRTRAQLALEIAQDPAGWSPAALTRAIAQDGSLPVAAYVGGLGEMAYHAQLVPLRDFAGVPRTPFVPRFSCTVIEVEVEASLAKLELTAESVLRGGGALDLGHEDAPPAVIEELREISKRAARELNQQREALAALDPMLAANLKRTGDQIRALVEKVSEKAERVHQNKSGKGQRHLRRVSHALFPRGLPQERVLGPLYFIAHHGRHWIDELFVHVPAVPRAHLLVTYTYEPEEST